MSLQMFMFSCCRKFLLVLLTVVQLEQQLGLILTVVLYVAGCTNVDKSVTSSHDDHCERNEAWFIFCLWKEEGRSTDCVMCAAQVMQCIGKHTPVTPSLSRQRHQLNPASMQHGFLFNRNVSTSKMEAALTHMHVYWKCKIDGTVPLCLWDPSCCGNSDEQRGTPINMITHREHCK